VVRCARQRRQLYDAAGQLAGDRSAVREAAAANLKACLAKLANYPLLTA
jgi:hypothetical protein